ncbi:helix-turn-helix transcriptional regulator [Streptomyces sp. NPDC097619]|uniref:helix-turn-helix domain-containing protein n=1 Tax=Streptomyces sp. NPDC097619 TaxID=3157228 RepID=UPI003324B1D4
MTAILRRQLDRRGLSQGQVAVLVGRHRSQISRALSGRSVPPRPLIEDLARRSGADLSTVMDLWSTADTIRRQGLACRREGAPPDGLADYPELLRALRGLVAWSGCPSGGWWTATRVACCGVPHWGPSSGESAAHRVRPSSPWCAPVGRGRRPWGLGRRPGRRSASPTGTLDSRGRRRPTTG